MKSVKSTLYKLIAEQKIAPKDAMLVFKELQANEKFLYDDIAIIGMSGRLPQANNPEEYWKNLRDSVNCVSKFSEKRKNDIESVLTEEQKSNVTYRSGGYLNEVDSFDAGFFRISPKEAKYMEPEQRLFLEVAWEAIEDSGYADEINGTNTGVYVGHDHVTGAVYKNYTGGLENDDTLALTGTYPSILSSRISYILDLKGPSIVIDTACSSGLISVHQACLALKYKECDMAIAGGISLQLWPVKFKSFKMVETNDDIVRAFDRNSSGTVWGEGVCVFMLKPLSKALEDKDNIHGIIKGSAINNDGVSSGITAPNAEAQEKVIIKAWEEAKVEPETIAYIETHGTGTVMGDPVEIKALRNAFSRTTKKKQFCAIGSLKPSIGHLISASGTASLMKVLLAMKNKQIPATINFDEPNPYIDFCNSQLYLNDKLQEWKKEEYPRRAGVSCFGFSGTNCHMVVEEAPELNTEELPEGKQKQVLVLTAKNRNVLENMLKAYRAYLDKNPEAKLEDICYTASTGRRHLEYRLAVVVSNKSELGEKLELIKDCGFETIENKGIYYGYYRIVNKQKETKAEGEFTEFEKQQLTESINEEISSMLEAGKDYAEVLDSICRGYVQGADISWRNLVYGGKKHKRISIPVYPFEGTRYWYIPEKQEEDDSIMRNRRTEEESRKVHPLLGSCIAETISNTTYRNEIWEDGYWILSDHKLLGESVLPGTAYIEMAHKACSAIYSKDEFEFIDFTFLAPLFVGKGEQKEIYTVVNRAGDLLEVVICSKLEEKWVKHAQGKAVSSHSREAAHYNIKEITDRCKSEVKSDAIKNKTAIAEFGARWNNIGKTFAGNNEMLVCIELPDEISGDLKDYHMHPAMLDNAVNMAIRLNENNDYLPFIYRSLRIYGKMPKRFYSYLKFYGTTTEGRETVSFDIALLDENGRAFLEAENYTIKKVHVKDFKTGKLDLFYQTRWIPLEQETGSSLSDPGAVLVLADGNGLGDKLVEELKVLGGKPVKVLEAAEYQKLGEDIYGVDDSIEGYTLLMNVIKEKNISRIVHLRTITGKGKAENLEQLKESKRRGVESLFNLNKAMAANKPGKDIQILLVADYANEVTRKEDRINPHNAAFFGLAKVVNQENSNIKCRCMDIDDNTSVKDITGMLLSEVSPFMAAFRDGGKYIEELTKAELDDIEDNELEIKSGGVYVITGGAGGIGLEMAKHLSSLNKVSLCLIGRSKISESQESNKSGSLINAMKAIEETGSQVDYYSCDITNEQETVGVLDSIRRKCGRIDGILHCAGVAGNGFIIRKDKESFDRVISPKMQGIWILDKLTEGDQLDFFIMFSSIIAIMGSAGQSDYAAGNAYLEAYPAYRNKKSGKTITVSWAAWKETGMAAANGFNEIRAPFKPIGTSAAITAFHKAVNKKLDRITIGELDAEVMSAIMDDLGINISNALRKSILAKGSDSKTAGRAKPVPKDIHVELKGRDNGKYTATEEKIGKIWAGILDIGEIDVYDSFMQLGGDSIIATEIFKEMQNEFGNIVDVADIFSYSTISQMAEYINKETNLDNEPKLTLEDIVNRLARGEITVSEASKLRAKIGSNRRN